MAKNPKSDGNFLKDKFTKRPTDFWNEDAIKSNEIIEHQRESFLMSVQQRNDGIDAEREKFIHGMYTNSHKVLPANRRDKV